jgi:hypothetical protein
LKMLVADDDTSKCQLARDAILDEGRPPNAPSVLRMKRSRACRRLCKPDRPSLASSGGGVLRVRVDRSASICAPDRESERLWILWTVWTIALDARKGAKKEPTCEAAAPAYVGSCKEKGCGSPSSVCK